MTDPHAAGDDTSPHALVEAEPDTAAALFGDRIGLARRYATLLAGDGIVRGLLGPQEAARIWSRHLLNCAVVAELVPTDARVVDIGSGAGLPGIVLALARPDLRVDLVEPLLRRSTFLTEVVTTLGLTSCRVVRARAEQASGQVGDADVVTARAVAPLARLAGWAAPLLRPGGLLLALKGSSAAAEIDRDAAAVRRAGIVGLTVRTAGAGAVREPATVVVGRRSPRRGATPRNG